MTSKIKKQVKRGAAKIKSFLCRPIHEYGVLERIDKQPSSNHGHTDKGKHVTIIEKVSDMATTVNSSRKSITSSVLHTRRRSTSIDSTRPDPILPPELIEKIASYMTQHGLLKFSKVSRDAYTASERHLYRRPFTRRFDRLLRTLEKSPYKGELILELALGFETDFYSVK